MKKGYKVKVKGNIVDRDDLADSKILLWAGVETTIVGIGENGLYELDDNGDLSLLAYTFPEDMLEPIEKMKYKEGQEVMIKKVLTDGFTTDHSGKRTKIIGIRQGSYELDIDHGNLTWKESDLEPVEKSKYKVGD